MWKESLAARNSKACGKIEASKLWGIHSEKLQKPGWKPAPHRKLPFFTAVFCAICWQTKKVFFIYLYSDLFYTHSNRVVWRIHTVQRWTICWLLKVVYWFSHEIIEFQRSLVLEKIKKFRLHFLVKMSDILSIFCGEATQLKGVDIGL